MAEERWPLGFGCVAVIQVADDDRAPYRPPAPDRGQRRDQSTGHIWETCPCAECAQRRQRQGIPGT
jgi:hypothetical protein